jgi:hypothetical protein
MPNGGSDCWFNARNKGVAGLAHAKDLEPSHCDIRNLEPHSWACPSGDGQDRCRASGEL